MPPEQVNLRLRARMLKAKAQERLDASLNPLLRGLRARYRDLRGNPEYKAYALERVGRQAEVRGQLRRRQVAADFEKVYGHQLVEVQGLERRMEHRQRAWFTWAWKEIPWHEFIRADAELRRETAKLIEAFRDYWQFIARDQQFFHAEIERHGPAFFRFERQADIERTDADKVVELERRLQVIKRIETEIRRADGKSTYEQLRSLKDQYEDAAEAMRQRQSFHSDRGFQRWPPEADIPGKFIEWCQQRRRALER